MLTVTFQICQTWQNRTCLLQTRLLQTKLPQTELQSISKLYIISNTHTAAVTSAMLQNQQQIILSWSGILICFHVLDYPSGGMLGNVSAYTVCFKCQVEGCVLFQQDAALNSLFFHWLTISLSLQLCFLHQLKYLLQCMQVSTKFDI